MSRRLRENIGFYILIIVIVAVFVNYPGINLWHRLFPPVLAVVDNPNQYVDYEGRELREIWLAGGCFWGVEAYMNRVYGVAEVISGYANGTTVDPTYQEIGSTGHAETVLIQYDPLRVSLEEILFHYFRIIDPLVENRQGPDVGVQYRTAIFYQNEAERSLILEYVAREQEKYDEEIVTQVELLQGFYPAESYHQDYLEKNPGGYCHINLNGILDIPPVIDPGQYYQPPDDVLAEQLKTLEFAVTRLDDTEPSFENAYWNNGDTGLYVDRITGEPLFASSDKFESGTGWPSFTHPVSPEVITTSMDLSKGMIRTEVRSRVGDNHLGHVFKDGPTLTGGLRYCINSASLLFIPVADMDQEGYGHLIIYVL